MADIPFWERPDVVAQFGTRDPDRRLAALLSREGAAGLRVLDVGCAAGRNLRYLAAAGADAWGIDASAAMVEAARSQLQPLLGEAEARRRVLRGRMDDLGAFADSRFDLVLLFGVLQNAGSDGELDRAIAEVRRVLTPDGRCLVANFAPDSRPAGVPLTPVEGERHVFTGFGGPHGLITLLAPAELDLAFARHGLHPLTPSEAVHVPMQRGHRTTVNAFYGTDLRDRRRA